MIPFIIHQNKSLMVNVAHLKFFGENFIMNVLMVTISLSINPYRDLELADY